MRDMDILVDGVVVASFETQATGSRHYRSSDGNISGIAPTGRMLLMVVKHVTDWPNPELINDATGARLDDLDNPDTGVWMALNRDPTGWSG
jgi:hypothetical protein